uniref:Putative secreted protein n=1 Tax=Panstrongylus lignarius TaxID=156445 RepID=A0A224XXU8_9HEMI
MAVGVEFGWFVLRVVLDMFLSLVLVEVVFVKDFVVCKGSVTSVTVDDTSTPKTFVAFISGTLVARLDGDC